MTARDWFITAAATAGMFAPAFLLYSTRLWVAAVLTVGVAAVPAIIGLTKLR